MVRYLGYVSGTGEEMTELFENYEPGSASAKKGKGKRKPIVGRKLPIADSNAGKRRGLPEGASYLERRPQERDTNE